MIYFLKFFTFYSTLQIYIRWQNILKGWAWLKISSCVHGLFFYRLILYCDYERVWECCIDGGSSGFSRSLELEEAVHFLLFFTNSKKQTSIDFFGSFTSWLHNSCVLNLIFCMGPAAQKSIYLGTKQIVSWGFDR
jgi:hypothetical protein